MSTTTDFVTRLVRSANQTHTLRPVEVQRLLAHSISMIRELRNESGIIPISGRDAIIYLETVAAGADRLPPEEWFHALLHAAEMIRDLRVVLDTGTDITIVAKKL